MAAVVLTSYRPPKAGDRVLGFIRAAGRWIDGRRSGGTEVGQRFDAARHGSARLGSPPSLLILSASSPSSSASQTKLLKICQDGTGNNLVRQDAAPEEANVALPSHEIFFGKATKFQNKNLKNFARTVPAIIWSATTRRRRSQMWPYPPVPSHEIFFMQ